MSLRSVLSKDICQRAARRAHGVLRRRLELRLRLGDHLAQRPHHVSPTGGGFAITTPTNTTDWHTSNAPSWRAAPTYSIDETLTWQKARAHVHLRRQRPDLQRRRPPASRSSAASRSASTRTSTRRPAMFNTTNFPGASAAQLTAAREHLRGPDRPRDAASTARPCSTRPGKYVELAPSTLEGRHQRLRDVRAGFVEAAAEPDPDRRHPLRHPDAVQAVQQRHVVGDDGERVRTLGSGRRRSLQQVQLQQPERVGRRDAGVHPAGEGHRRATRPT